MPWAAAVQVLIYALQSARAGCALGRMNAAIGVLLQRGPQAAGAPPSAPAAPADLAATVTRLQESVTAQSEVGATRCLCGSCYWCRRA